VVAVARFAEKYGLAVNFFAKPACQPLLLLHGGQAFLFGRQESGVSTENLFDLDFEVKLS